MPTSDLHQGCNSEWIHTVHCGWFFGCPLPSPTVKSYRTGILSTAAQTLHTQAAQLSPIHQFKKGRKVTRMLRNLFLWKLKKLYCRSKKSVSLSMTYQFVDYSTYLNRLLAQNTNVINRQGRTSFYISYCIIMTSDKAHLLYSPSN